MGSDEMNFMNPGENVQDKEKYEKMHRELISIFKIPVVEIQLHLHLKIKWFFFTFNFCGTTKRFHRVAVGRALCI